jgi:hypothetical protein
LARRLALTPDLLERPSRGDQPSFPVAEQRGALEVLGGDRGELLAA